MKEIIPAILTNDIQDFERKIRVLEGLTTWIQIDVMDGIFVANYSVHLDDIFKLRIPFSIELHLMVQYPKDYLLYCRHQGVKRCVFHIESDVDVSEMIAQVKESEKEVGIALNPKTHIEEVLPYLEDIDYILLLCVHPGKQGQTFIQEVLEKIPLLKAVSKDIKIGIDGGINLDNIELISKEAIDYAAVGSAIFKAENIQQRLKDFHAFIDKHNEHAI